jgi:hypothetical protein
MLINKTHIKIQGDILDYQKEFKYSTANLIYNNVTCMEYST